MGTVFNRSDVRDFYGFDNITNSRTNDSTLGESIFGKNESLDLTIKLSSGEELHLRATGATTMDLVQSLKRMLPNSAKNPLEGLY